MQAGNEGTPPLVSQNVVILAKNFKLSQTQFDLLNRGLTFIPTLDINKNQKQQLQLDIQEYHRKIKLASYFQDGKRKKLTPFVAATGWIPPPGKLPPFVEALIDRDKDSFRQHFRPRREKPNLTQGEVKALRELMHYKQIVIKPADKGSAVVILSREQYTQEVYRQLEDKTYYRKLDGPIYLKTIPIVKNILQNLKTQKFISDRQVKYLQGESTPRPRRFYILPKIHKAPDKWTIPYELPPGRPIVSDCSSETYRTAEFIDYYLNPLSIRHDSYVKDTYHFIEIVKRLKVPPNSFFFTIDIDSLYTNIDTPSGLRAVQKVFQKYPDVTRPDKHILDLLNINLTKNDFEFNGEFFLQIKGTAMGKKFAPAYANIFMAMWEEAALAKCPIQPLHYLRYLDDIWGIWTGTVEQFEQFIKILNSHDSSIKLKYSKHEDSIDFLDTTVYKGPTFGETQTLDIKVFFKETDTHALLFKTSFHPRHTFRGLIKSQLIRFWRICTRRADFKDAVRILFSALRKRGYSRPFLRNCFKSFRDRKDNPEGEIIPLITTFSSVSLLLNHKFKDNFLTIIKNQGNLANHQIISAYRRNKNLRDLLVHAKLQPIGHVKINRLEKYFCHLTYVRNTTTRRIFKIVQRFNWRSTNCVYIIFCSKCGRKYVGETGNSISLRMTQHVYNIRNKKKMEMFVVRHFVFHGLDSLRVAGLQRNISWSDSERKTAERRWITNLSTRNPLGLNS